MRKLVMTMAAMVLLTFSALAQAQLDEDYMIHLQPGCGISSHNGSVDSMSELQNWIDSGLAKSWYRWYPNSVEESGPCQNVIPETHSQSEQCTYNCSTLDEEDNIFVAYYFLLNKYNCVSPSPYCNVTAADTYNVQLYLNDPSDCKKYHWQITFVMEDQSVWLDKRHPAFSSMDVTQGHNLSDWTYYNCDPGEVIIINFE